MREAAEPSAQYINANGNAAINQREQLFCPGSLECHHLNPNKKQKKDYS